MKVVQTFWTGKKSLLENSFGWVNPQYHLMSWALSCLSLKEHYENVVLYTDSNGYKAFVELLELPYKDVIVHYDNLNCPEPHWAYPKIVTYSLQDEPFIHVDGDVYLPERLNHNIEKSGLIAQNLEIGSSYYKNMMNDVLQRDISLPYYLEEELNKDSIGSYNAGILGGNNLEFIKEYCQIAFDIIEINHLNDIDSQKINVNNNILFEQILFYALSTTCKTPVTTVLDHSVRDNGYTYQSFCNFYKYNNAKLLHVLGGHKRNQRICELLGKTLLDKYPDYYKKIIELFPSNHKRMREKNRYTITPNLSVRMCIASYYDHLNELSSKWKLISNEELYAQQKCASAYISSINDKGEIPNSCILKKNPNLSIFEIPKHWPLEAKHLLWDRINKDIHFGNFDIACIPCLLDKGFKEVVIKDLSYNILMLLEDHKTFDYLFNELRPSLSSDINNDMDQVFRMVMGEIEYLLYNGLICIESF